MHPIAYVIKITYVVCRIWIRVYICFTTSEATSAGPVILKSKLELLEFFTQLLALIMHRSWTNFFPELIIRTVKKHWICFRLITTQTYQKLSSFTSLATNKIELSKSSHFLHLLLWWVVILISLLLRYRTTSFVYGVELLLGLLILQEFRIYTRL
jgi:hypothetical protein